MKEFEFFKIDVLTPTLKTWAEAEKGVKREGASVSVAQINLEVDEEINHMTLEYLGSTGWELKTVLRKENESFVTETFYMQRDSLHPLYGKDALDKEFFKLCKEKRVEWKNEKSEPDTEE